MTENEKIAKLKELIDIQHSDGNFNYDEYMYGMLNGMVLALSVFTEEDCIYPIRPKIFKTDHMMLDKFNKSPMIVSRHDK